MGLQCFQQISIKQIINNAGYVAGWGFAIAVIIKFHVHKYDPTSAPVDAIVEWAKGLGITDATPRPKLKQSYPQTHRCQLAIGRK